MGKCLALGIDTSSSYGSIALVDEKGLLASETIRVQAGHARGLSHRIEGLFQAVGQTPKALSAIGVVNGPGSFTALRVGVATAQGLGMGLNIPVIPVGAMQAIIAGAPGMEGRALALIPARKGEVFGQTFAWDGEGIGWKPECVVKCLKIEELSEFGEKFSIITGPGADAHPEEIMAIFGNDVLTAPLSCRYARGEVIAQQAVKMLNIPGSDYSPENVQIHYLQSHGALTIEEREKGLKT